MSEQKSRRLPNPSPESSPETGRKIGFKPDIGEKILSYVRAGAYVETAVAAAGVAKSTYYNWLSIVAQERANDERCRQNGQHYRMTPKIRQLLRFVDATEKAMAESEVSDLLRIKLASEKYWQAAAWRLERKFPKKYGRHKPEEERTMVNPATITEDIEDDLERAYGDEPGAEANGEQHNQP